MNQTSSSSIRGITNTSGVCGGDPCIAGTRIAVWMLEAMRRLGVSDAAILASYPGLSANDLAHAWSYVAQHTQEIEEQIVENENA